MDIVNRKRSYSSGNCKSQTRLYNSLIKYGFRNHTFDIIHSLPIEATVEEMNLLEKHYYDYYKNNGHNMMNLTIPGVKVRMSDETKEKIRKARIGTISSRRGVPLSADHKLSLSISLKGNKNGLGHKKSIEEVEKIRQRAIKMGATDECKNRIGSLWRGKKLPEYLRKKLSEARIGRFVGEKHSMVKLKESQVIEIKKMLFDGINGTTIGRKFNVCKSTVSLIKRGKIWSHLL